MKLSWHIHPDDGIPVPGKLIAPGAGAAIFEKFHDHSECKARLLEPMQLPVLEMVKRMNTLFKIERTINGSDRRRARHF